SFIEQGRIGQIVNARPEQRRALFEEAAGISRYKMRRDEALVKLSETEVNLERASDIVDDLQKRLRGLARQVERAGRYRRLQSRIKQAEVFLSLARYAALSSDRKILDEELQGAIALEGRLDRVLRESEGGLKERRAGLQVMESGVGRLRDELAELEARRREQESARQYQSRELQTLDRRQALLTGQLAEHHETRQTATAELASVSTERAEVEERFGSIDGDLKEARAASAALEKGIRDRQTAIDRHKAEQLKLVSRISGHKAAMESASERRFDLERRRGRLREQHAAAGGENEQITGQLAEAEERIAEATAAVEAHRDAIAESRAAVSRCDAERGETNRARKAAEKEMTRTEREQTRQRARLDALQAMQSAHEGVEDDVRAALKVPGVQGTLAEHLDVPVALEAQLAAALGPALDAILADDDAVALAAARAAKGRALVFSLHDAAPATEGLAALIGGTDIGRRALGGLLGTCRQAGTLQEALDLHRQTGDRVVVSGGGHAVVSRRGEIIVGEPRSVGIAILARRRQIAALEETCAVAAAAAEVAREAVEAVIDTQGRLEEALAEAREAAEQARAESADADMSLRQARQEHNELIREQQRQSSAAQKLVNELRELDQALRAHDDAVRRREDAIAEDMERQEEVEEELSENQVELVEEREEAEEAREALNTLAAEAGGLRERLGGLRRAEAAARAAADNAARQIAAQESEQEQASARIIELKTDDVRLNVSLQEIGERQGTLRIEMDESRAKVKAERVGLAALEQALKDTREQLTAAREERIEIDQQLTRINLERARIQESLQEKHRIAVEKLLQRIERDGHATLPADPAARTDGLPGAPPLSESEQAYLEDLRITEVVMGDEAVVQVWMRYLEADRAALGRLGEVNLIAVQEYTEVAERFETLSAQRADLEVSIKTIQQTIARLNRTCRERFRETFDTVNIHFQEIYPRLVGGGSARLQLTDEEDLLETGVEIFAQPPGKRLQSLSLLSGGETAMVAIALIFSLFRVKPSPFCLLDEVDAPLDEGNGARFNRMLQEMAVSSQFIVITHNKKTMECADTLYGVTMDPPGISTVVSVNLD
ncbi:MAG: chromosome segregation protein, partial [Myxococcota bacterium]